MNNDTKQSTPMWGGRFTEAPDPLFRAFNDSFGFDFELLADDIDGSIAWAGALANAGVLSADERDAIAAALGDLKNIAGDSLRVAVENGEFEDVHSFVESKLREKVGALAGKLHTGRSRNDQVATDLKLYVRRALADARSMTLQACLAFAQRAEAEADAVMPGYTHMKQAEPVTFGHWCLAYGEMLLRDAHRFAAALERIDECPLGSGALAGTPVALDRESLAQALGFSRANSNSLDGVSDRDFVVDYLHAASMLLVHLSRFAEDLIAYSTDEFGYVELPDSLSTGSSRMPQKKNPDLPELIRGHAARSIGELTAMLTLIKGLPLAYNKDLQLDKEPVFRMRRILSQVLPLVAQLVNKLTIRREVMRKASSSDLLLATQVADVIAARGIPFREAHERVSRKVGAASRTGVALANVEPDVEVTAEDLGALNVDAAVARKSSVGGTSPERVIAAAKQLQSKVRG